MKKKVLVTGATGFLGNYVVNELLAAEHTVIATARSEEKAKEMPWYGRVTFIAYDLRSPLPANCFQYFHEPETAIHLAWEGLPNYRADFHVTENLPRHLDFLEHLVAGGLKDLTVSGTCLEYGLQEGMLNEAMETHPVTAYAIAKDRLRASLEQVIAQHRGSLKWVRLFYMFGKGQHPNSLLSQLDRAIANKDSVFRMSGGEQERDYLPVEAVARALVRIALQDKVDGIINCCSGQPVKIIELVRNYLSEKRAAIQLETGYYPYPDYEPMAFWGDNRKLKSVLEHG
ncbi:MAG TPA: NAD-dependent epimerase/dehydratase family protein [Chitinophagaceae bacterium]